MSQPLLELHLHLANGNTHRFVQNDAQLAQQIIQQINPKVFAQPTLVIFGQDTVVAYPGQALIGIDLVMEPLPEELLNLLPSPAIGITEVQEITEDDYQAVRRAVWPIEEGKPFVSVNEIELSNGHRFWVEVHAQAAVSERRERHILHNLFSEPSLICRRLGGGISLWNRAQIVSFSFCPKPAVPTTAWPAELV